MDSQANILPIDPFLPVNIAATVLPVNLIFYLPVWILKKLEMKYVPKYNFPKSRSGGGRVVGLIAISSTASISQQQRILALFLLLIHSVYFANFKAFCKLKVRLTKQLLIRIKAANFFHNELSFCFSFSASLTLKQS